MPARSGATATAVPRQASCCELLCNRARSHIENLLSATNFELWALAGASGVLDVSSNCAGVQGEVAAARLQLQFQQRCGGAAQHSGHATRINRCSPLH